MGWTTVDRALCVGGKQKNVRITIAGTVHGVSRSVGTQHRKGKCTNTVQGPAESTDRGTNKHGVSSENENAQYLVPVPRKARKKTRLPCRKPRASNVKSRKAQSQYPVEIRVGLTRRPKLFAHSAASHSTQGEIV